MLYSQMVSPAVRQAVLEQMKKGGYKMPSLKAFNIESFGSVSHVIYAGNM
jgi:DNA-binding LacI/PurR family transcriptional regulator